MCGKIVDTTIVDDDEEVEDDDDEDDGGNMEVDLDGDTTMSIPVTSSKGPLNNMISTITEFSRGSMNMIFAGDMNEYEFPDLYNSRRSWPSYTMMKVPHHCSKFSIDNLFSTIVANVYLISGQTGGNTLQPAGTCLQEIILQRRISNPNIGTAHIFVTNWDSSGKNNLSSILENTVAPTNSYRIYVLNGGVTDGQFRVSDSGDVVIITNQWTDMTPGSQPRFDKVLTNPFPQADPSYAIGQLVYS